MKNIPQIKYGVGTAATQEPRRSIPQTLPVINLENKEGGETVEVIVQVEDDVQLYCLSSSRV